MIFRYFKSKVFLINIIAAIVFVIAITWGIFFGIDKYTSHNNEIIVPKLIGLDTIQAKDSLKKHTLVYQIIDSVFLDNIKRSSIVEQTPKAGSKIKKNRKIFITINASSTEKIVMPELIGASLRQAITDAETFGLKIGEKKYVPHFAQNYVLKQYYKGIEIKAGVRIPKGAYIDLDIGRGDNSEKMLVPNLLGKSYLTADSIANNSFLNISGIFYNEDIKTKKDTQKAVVYKQDPMPTKNNNISMGSFIDIWLSTDTNLVPNITIDTTSTDLTNEDDESNL